MPLDPPDRIGLTALLGLAAGVAACGGGDGPGLPAAFGQPEQATRRHMLSAPSSDFQMSGSTLAVPSADAVMDWAQRNYPDWFPGSPATQSLDPYRYRHYPATQNYIGVADGRVYVLGSISGGELLEVGSLADFAALVAADPRTAVPQTDAEAARFLLQAQFSATRAEITQVRSLGYARWLDEQIGAPAGITAWDWLDSRGYTAIDSYGYYGNGYQVDFALWHQLITSPDAVRKRAALALSEFFVGTLEGVGSPWRSWVICDYWDVLSANAFGNFRTLLGKVSLHSATGQLLTVVGSRKADPVTGQMPDENFARELMQLFTIGLVELHLDGTEKLDAAGRPIETYSQEDVTQLARVFTGYNLAPVRTFDFVQAGAPFLNYPDISQARLPMVCDPALHSNEPVQFLNVSIPANTPPERKLAMALDGLFMHPNVGPFFGKQMIQRMVTSNPSPGYVARVASVFNDNGQGVRGDLAAVFKAVLLDPEARGPGGLVSQTFGKLREPMVRIAQLARSFGLHSKRGSWKLIGMPQVPLTAPSVFNFYRPGHRLPGARSGGRKLLAPEFQIVDEVAVADYVNLIRGVSGGGLFVPAPDIPAFYVNQFDTSIIRTAAADFDLVCRYSDELSLTPHPEALVDHLNLVLAAGQVSQATCQAIVAGVRANFGGGLDSTHPLEERFQLLSWAVTMMMSSPEYLIQK